ncbi:hypothetical protein TIFTF001_025068 [Ficus carica]|uniref:Uncharacterized protein n=1 Tax=Ficus carica TaxID=3494 RepID=A0AA88AQP5_FICCA|nr:hypothetical protein TIFTF001_025068 [Ficus carica]
MVTQEGPYNRMCKNKRCLCKLQIHIVPWSIPGCNSAGYKGLNSPACGTCAPVSSPLELRRRPPPWLS